MIGLQYIEELYEKNLFAIYDGFDNWEEAVLAAIKPLEEQGYVEHGYALAAIEHVNEYGPYIFLAPHVCMPHCAAYEYVKKPGVAFVKSNKTVFHKDLDKDMGAELFFAICATEAGEHLKEISRIAEILEEQDLVKALVEAKSKEDFENLFKEI